jgi:hypothetical protein
VRLNNLGGVLGDLGDLAAAQDCYQRALHIIERSFGPRHRSLAIVRDNLGQLLERAGDPARADEQYALAVEITAAAFGPTHPDTERARARLERMRSIVGLDPVTGPVPPVSSVE